MATIEIDGRRVAVNDAFLKLSPEEQNATVDEIAASFKSSKPQPDQYQQAAIDEDKSLGGTNQAGFTRRLAHGATLGADSTILAGLSTPLEMIKRGTFNPAEGYNYAKAREDYIMDKSRANTGVLGTGAEVLGGAVTGAGLAKGGVTAARFLAPEAGLLGRSTASAVDAGLLGGFSGAMEGNGVAERFNNAVKGLAAGTALGGLTPGALKLAGAALSPLVSNIRARINPQGYAESQVARAIHESGTTPNQLSLDAVQAANEGQGAYTLADAMGNAGQRMLSTVARAPGEGRTAIVNALENRQAGQGQRLAQITDEALGASGTGRQTTDQLTKTAQTESAPFYEKALSNKPVWNERIQQFFDDPVTQQGLKEGVAVQRLESLAKGEKFNPQDYAITGFNEAGDPILSGVPNMRTINLIKKGWDNTLEGYRDGTTGRLMLDEKGRALDAVRRSFLKEVDNLNPDYGTARSLYAGPAQVRDAVNMGAKAPIRGRAADNIDQFNRMTEPTQQGYRMGYADTLSARAEKGPPGVNKARPLLSDKSAAELQAFATPGRAEQLQRQIGREQTMFETRNHALGGSRTADNLNDHAAMAVDPHLVGQIMTGNWHGAVRTALSAGHNALSGNTPAVRKEVANILLQSGQDVSPARLEKMVTDTIARIKFVQSIAQNVGRGASGGLAVAIPGAQRRQ